MNPGLRALVKGMFSPRASSSVSVCGIEFPNRVGLAAGFDKNAVLVDELACFGFSHIEIGTVTPKGQPGNPKPRSFRVKRDQALINRMGFNNEGVDMAVRNLKKRKSKIIVGGNIGKNTATPNEMANGDYLYCFDQLYDVVDYITINVSCPNIKNLHGLQNKDELTALLATIVEGRAKKVIRKPVFVKISPDLSFDQVDDMLDIINNLGIDGVIATNTSTRRDLLSISEEKIQAIGNGGLSGKPVKELSTKMIRYISQKTAGNLPLIAVGGIMTPEDAKEKIDAGASLVQIYTGFIYSGPCLVKKIVKRIG